MILVIQVDIYNVWALNSTSNIIQILMHYFKFFLKLWHQCLYLYIGDCLLCFLILMSFVDGTQTLPMLHSRVKRSSSLTPPGNTISHSSCSPLSSNTNLDQENLPFSQSNLRADHAPLSPQSSVTSSGSGSDGQKDEKDVFSQEGTGMKGYFCDNFHASKSFFTICSWKLHA